MNNTQIGEDSIKQTPPLHEQIVCLLREALLSGEFHNGRRMEAHLDNSPDLPELYLRKPFRGNT
jgi:hypothetical protein